MSYILDALRRADSERARGAVPGLHTPSVAHAGAGASDHPPARWAGPAAAVAGLAIAGLAGGWLWMREAPSATPGVVLATGAASDPAQVPPSTVPATLPVTPSSTAAMPAPSPAPAVVAAAPQPSFAPAVAQPPAPTAVAAPPAVVRVVPAPARAPAASERTAMSPGMAQTPASAGMAGTTGASGSSTLSARTAPAPISPRAEASASASSSVATAPASATAAPTPAIAPAPAAAAPRVYALGELPPDVRQRMPVLAVSGATYSANPTYRMVIVNGQVLHEGDTAGPGVALERIDPKSVVLAFQGYRVRVGY